MYVFVFSQSLASHWLVASGSVGGKQGRLQHIPSRLHAPFGQLSN